MAVKIIDFMGDTEPTKWYPILLGMGTSTPGERLLTAKL